jgi:hypothetical protein
VDDPVPLQVEGEFENLVTHVALVTAKQLFVNQLVVLLQLAGAQVLGSTQSAHMVLALRVDEFVQLEVGQLVTRLATHVTHMVFVAGVDLLMLLQHTLTRERLVAHPAHKVFAGRVNKFVMFSQVAR